VTVYMRVLVSSRTPQTAGEDLLMLSNVGSLSSAWIIVVFRFFDLFRPTVNLALIPSVVLRLALSVHVVTAGRAS
jgi:hypothetical protein